MIVKRKPLNLFERLYLPAIIGGFKVTLRHLFKKKVTMQYPEEKWVVPEGYRGAPYLVKDQEGNTKCVSCQLCEFVCPPKAIKITPPGPVGQLADRPNAEKMPKEFEINMLRCIFCGMCVEACPEDAIRMVKVTPELPAADRGRMWITLPELLTWQPARDVAKPYPPHPGGPQAGGPR